MRHAIETDRQVTTDQKVSSPMARSNRVAIPRGMMEQVREQVEAMQAQAPDHAKRMFNALDAGEKASVNHRIIALTEAVWLVQAGVTVRAAGEMAGKSETGAQLPFYVARGIVDRIPLPDMPEPFKTIKDAAEGWMAVVRKGDITLSDAREHIKGYRDAEAPEATAEQQARKVQARVKRAVNTIAELDKIADGVMAAVAVWTAGTMVSDGKGGQTLMRILDVTHITLRPETTTEQVDAATAETPETAAEPEQVQQVTTPAEQTPISDGQPATAPVAEPVAVPEVRVPEPVTM